MENEEQLIRESLKVGGMKHRSISIASHTFFTHEEEKYIREKFNISWNLNLSVSENDIMAWAWECAAIYNKADRFGGGRTWLIGFCARAQISIQVSWV